MRTPLAVSGLTLLALTACGSSPVTDDTRPTDEPRVSCQSTLSFPVSAMDGGIAPSVPHDEIVGALRRLVDESPEATPPQLVHADIETAPWIVLAESDDELTLGVGSWSSASGAAKDAMSLTLKREGDGWKATSWGSCRTLSPELPSDKSWVDVHADSADLSPFAVTLPVEVSERACTSARDPRPYLDEPRVAETDESVTVYWTSDAFVGMANCLGNPPTPMTVTLKAPLGDRQVYDGSVWPPASVTGDSSFRVGVSPG